MLARFINWVSYLHNGRVPENEINENIINSMVDMLASIVIWLVLYFFIFEMRIVKDKLDSEGPEEFKMRSKITNKARNITMISTLVISIIIWVLHLLFIIEDKNKEPHMQLWSCLVDLSLRVLKILIDTYLLVTFLELLGFFVSQKREQLEARED